MHVYARLVVSLKTHDGGLIQILTIQGLKKEIELKVEPVLPNQIVFLPAFNTIAFTNYTGSVRFLIYRHDVTELEEKAPVRLHDEVICTLVPVPNTSTLLSISSKNEVCLFNLSRGISYKRCQLVLH